MSSGFAILPLKTVSYTAYSQYFRAVCGNFTLDSAEYAGNRENTVNQWAEVFVR